MAGSRREYLVDAQHGVYLTRTPDGRILFGSREPYAFGSQISDEQDRHARL